MLDGDIMACATYDRKATECDFRHSMKELHKYFRLLLSWYVLVKGRCWWRLFLLLSNIKTPLVALMANNLLDAFWRKTVPFGILIQKLWLDVPAPKFQTLHCKIHCYQKSAIFCNHIATKVVHWMENIAAENAMIKLVCPKMRGFPVLVDRWSQFFREFRYISVIQ